VTRTLRRRRTLGAERGERRDVRGELAAARRVRVLSGRLARAPDDPAPGRPRRLRSLRSSSRPAIALRAPA